MRIQCWILLAPLLAAPNSAWAQRTGNNAVVQASDAFGRAVGTERTGIYTQDDVRGFSPLDAGNARIEGLYFDQAINPPMRVIDGSFVRVGISAQGYPFPAPTGLVDYALTKPGDRFEGNLDIDTNHHGGIGGSLEFKIPLDGNRFGIGGGVGARSQAKVEGESSYFRNYGATLAWRPYKDAEIVAFGGGFVQGGDEARATLFPLGDALPPEIARRKFFGQDWARRNSVSLGAGILAKLPLGDWRIDAGLFRSQRDSELSFADLVTGVRSDGSSTGRTVIADGNNYDGSTSGEFRVTRRFTTGAIGHELVLNFRGRSRNRQFGGTVPIALGPSFADRPDPRPEPAYVLGDENIDRVRQATYGFAYRFNWPDKGSLDFSVAKSIYRKSVDFADPARADTITRDRPLLWSVAGSVILSRRFALYGGYVAGQEEALIAPDIATNRSEAPPAIRTRQFDAGLRYAVTDSLTFVAGVFSVTKPYFNLDPTLRYRQLGTVRNRGVELSLAGRLRPGFLIVAGTVLLDPKISGEAVQNGLIGMRPVGQVRRRSILNLDWRQDQGRGPLSLDMAVESYSARTGNSRNTILAPAYGTVSIGARYRFDLFGTKALLRPQVQNLFNKYGWQVSPSGGFGFNQDRTVSLQLLVDF